MKKLLTSFTMIAASCFFPTLGYSDTDIASPQIAVGRYYNDPGKHYFSLAAFNSPEGTHWVYSKWKHLIGGAMTNASCNTVICLTTGNNDNDYLPIAAVSTDRGATWVSAEINEIHPTKDFSNNVDGARLTCNSMMCAMQLAYMKQDGLIAPYFITTQDGNHWSLRESPALPDGLSLTQTYGSFSCTDSVCLSTGILKKDRKHLIPYFSVSQDQGKNWTHHINPFQDTSYFDALLGACKGDHCLVIPSSTGWSSHTLKMAFSSTQGKQWTRLDLNLDTNLDMGTVTKQNNYWIITGYGWKNNSYTPILLIGKPILDKKGNASVEWKQQIIKDLPELKIHGISGRDYSVQCSEAFCAAMIRFDLTGQNNFTTALLLSDDHGESWSYKKLSFSVDFSPTAFYCSNKTCVMAGTGTEATKSMMQPMIVAVHYNKIDKKVSTELQSISEPPHNMEEGDFFGSGGSLI